MRSLTHSLTQTHHHPPPSVRTKARSVSGQYFGFPIGGCVALLSDHAVVYPHTGIHCFRTKSKQRFPQSDTPRQQLKSGRTAGIYIRYSVLYGFCRAHTPPTHRRSSVIPGTGYPAPTTKVWANCGYPYSALCPPTHSHSLHSDQIQKPQHAHSRIQSVLRNSDDNVSPIGNTHI